MQKNTKMSQEHDNQNLIRESNDNNIMSTVITNIEHQAKNFPELETLFKLKSSESAKKEIEKFKGMNSSLEKILATLFDKTIFSLYKRQKMLYKDYRFLFYVFFKNNNYRYFCLNLGHKNFSKFFKKFFNACMENRSDDFPSHYIFSVYDIGEFINCYICELYKLLSKDENIINIEKAEDIEELHAKKKDAIKNVKELDSICFKFMKMLIKYILAFCNILENNKYYNNYPVTIYKIFSDIKDKIFHAYFMKQLYKIYLHKGIYEHGNNFIISIFYPILYKKNKLSQYNFSLQTLNLIDSVLDYIPKYCINEKNKKMSYSKGSPFYFLNIIVLIKIMNDLLLDQDKQKILLFKFIDNFNTKINLFIDDDTQMQVAELILTDTVNNKIIMNNLNTLELIQHYLKNVESINNNQNFWEYFEYLFFDLSMSYYLFNFYENKTILNNALLSSGGSNSVESKLNWPNLNNSIMQSSQDIKQLKEGVNNEPKKKELNDSQIIINKFLFTQNYFIRKYFNAEFWNDINYETDIQSLLGEKNLEELFILLDIIYYISQVFEDEKMVEKAIQDIKNIIIYIIKKSYEKSKFNCCIYNFILNIDSKYIPSPDDFDILKSNGTILIKNSFTQFIRTYPLYIIFVINYFSINNYTITEFFKYIKAFLDGYSSQVFNLIDSNKDYNYTLQLNYLKIIHFIIEEILNIYMDKNSENIFNTNILVHLPYCINCKEKMKNPIIFSKYLSQCFYCGEKHLFINTNLNKYLSQYKEDIKEFTNENIFKVITDITCNVLIKFQEKYEKKKETSLFCYNLYYKLMNEHFKFLRNIQFILGKNIPFIINPDGILNKTEGALEQNIKMFYDNYLTKNNKYPLEAIYNTINDDMFISFNTYRKTIKHETALIRNKFNI